MTSSIYPILPSLADATITTPGAGYTTTPTVTIVSPPFGTIATGTANIADGVIDTTTLSTPGSGYFDGEEVTLSAGSISGDGAAGIAVISGGIIQSITFTDRGFGFDNGGTETVTITGVTSSVSNALFTVTAIADNALRSITLTERGIGYASAPNITITGGGGAGATAVGVLTIRVAPIAAASNVLISDIEITSNMVSPGGGGILRLYFSFDYAISPASVTVTNGGVTKGILNADNDGNTTDNGLYRFDIDVEQGDTINLTADEEITTINYVRAHLVQFGA